MLKLKVLGKVIESGLVAIVRTNSADQAARIAEACARGGAAAIEVTFTVPGATAVIEDLAKKYASGKFLSARAPYSILKQPASQFWPARNILSAPR